MKIAFKQIVKTYKMPIAIVPQSFTDEGSHSVPEYEIPSCSCLKPVSVTDNSRIKKLKEFDKMSKINGVFSLDRASELLKEKIDSQQMLYSEEDIKKVVKTVLEKHPKLKRADVLDALSKLSSFSNHDSFSIIEDFCKVNEISEVNNTNSLTINNIFSYLANVKKFIKLPYADENKKPNEVLFVDRETIKELKKQKTAKDSLKFDNLMASISNGSTKLVVLDGFEAKTKDGLKSFNFAGAWGDLTDSVLAVIDAKKNGKNPFVDDIVSDVKTLFGKDVKINIINNDCKNADEKIIADRLNPKTISKETIKKALSGISGYSLELSKNMKAELNGDKVSLEEIQSALTKIIYSAIDVYSPRRIASELSVLHDKIQERLSSLGKTTDDVLYVVPDKKKSFGLISYQYSKVNNIQNSMFVYPNYKDASVDKDLKRGKVFVFLDDFSGSGQSLIGKDLPYAYLKKSNPANPVIFAPIAYTKGAKETIEKLIKFQENELRRNTKDCFIGVRDTDDMAQYLKYIPKNARKVLYKTKNCGYNGGMSVIMFPHVIPDNCADITGYLLKPLLESEVANKSMMEFRKECRIMSLGEKG